MTCSVVSCDISICTLANKKLKVAQVMISGEKSQP